MKPAGTLHTVVMSTVTPAAAQIGWLSQVMRPISSGQPSGVLGPAGTRAAAAASQGCVRRARQPGLPLRPRGPRLRQAQLWCCTGAAAPPRSPARPGRGLRPVLRRWPPPLTSEVESKGVVVGAVGPPRGAHPHRHRDVRAVGRAHRAGRLCPIYDIGQHVAVLARLAGAGQLHRGVGSRAPGRVGARDGRRGRALARRRVGCGRARGRGGVGGRVVRRANVGHASQELCKRLPGQLAPARGCRG